MRFFEWLSPGLRIKRWLLLGIIGILLISCGIALLISYGTKNADTLVTEICLIIVGIAFSVIAITFLARTFLNAIISSKLYGQVDSKTIGSILLEKRHLSKGAKIVVIGGGTGLSTMLRGLKTFTSNITAVVTVSDDGGGSGVLREDLGILPPGDIRNCILALAQTEPILDKLLQYRFKEGMLKGQNFGNLFLAAMTGVCGSFEEAVKKMSDVLAVTGNVLPVTVEDIRLCAELEDKSIVLGERNIAVESKKKNCNISRVFIEPSKAEALPEVIETIEEADVIIFGPGSLYTSIIPNFLVNGVVEAVRRNNGLKLYVCNIMTQKGETDNYTAYDHIEAIQNHGLEGCINYCIVNKGRINDTLRQKYNFDGAQRVKIDEYKILRKGIKLVKTDIIGINKGFIRHDPLKLAATILKLINEEIILKDKKRMIEYLYIKDKIKKMASG